MKKLIFYLVVLFTAQGAIAQSGSGRQVQWTYSAKKVAEKTFEVHMTATINGDYHLYSQDAGGDGPVATTFTFVKTPLLALDGKPRESGRLVSKFETAWGHDVKYYEKKVDFVQQIKLKGNAKTNLAGKVEFMVCNDKQCLPPAEVDIKVPIGG